MKFVCTKENLSNSLVVTSGIAGKQVHLPILSSILIKADESKVDISSTNLEIAIKAHMRAKVEKSGSFTVPAKTFSDYVSLLPDEQICVELKENQLHISCASSSTKIKGFDADEFPVIPEIEEEHPFAIDAQDFKGGLSKVVIAAAKNEIRPELSGIYFGFFTEGYKGLLLAATDSYRLAESKTSVKQGSENIECIVPARSVYEMIRLLGSSSQDSAETDVRLWVSENQVGFRYNNFEITSRLVDGTYPDYRQIIPNDFKTTVALPRDVLVNKIKAASLFATMGVNAVSFDLNKNENVVCVSSTSTQTGEHSSKIDAEIIGEDVSILLNHRYILEGLGQMSTEEVDFSLNGGDSPCLFKPKEKTDYSYIVMPIRQ